MKLDICFAAEGGGQGLIGGIRTSMRACYDKEKILNVEF